MGCTIIGFFRRPLEGGVACLGRSEMFRIYHLFFLNRNVGFRHAKITSEVVIIPKAKNNNLPAIFFPFSCIPAWNNFPGPLIGWSAFPTN